SNPPLDSRVSWVSSVYTNPNRYLHVRASNTAAPLPLVRPLGIYLRDLGRAINGKPRSSCGPNYLNLTREFKESYARFYYAEAACLREGGPPVFKDSAVYDRGIALQPGNWHPHWTPLTPITSDRVLFPVSGDQELDAFT